MSKKYCYLFTEGNAQMRELLGGKGANLAEMTNIGLPVPQGFTITTEACTQYYEDGQEINDEIMGQINEYIGKMEEIVGKKFGDITGRYYGFFEAYKMEDAETAVVLIGSSAGTARETVDELRAQGRKVGMIKVRVFRPFPFEEIAQALSGCKAVAVLDKDESFSTAGGPLFAETRSAMYDLDNRPKAINYVYGLGGRDFRVEDCTYIFDELDKIVETGKTGEVYRHIGQ